MRNRIDIIKDIVSFNRDLKTLNHELSQYPWDLAEPILEITANDVVKILHRAIANEITFEELEEWANLIECRDDVSFQTEELQEIIFQLANPTLHGEINKELLIELVNMLQTV